LWNTAYHHGANLQVSIYRPRFLEFEDRDGLLPTHMVGVWGSGKTSFRPDKWSYDVYLGNGPTVRRGFLDYNAFSDDNSGKMLGANVGWHPGGPLRGTTFGLHALGSTVDTRAASGALLARTRLRVFGAYAGIDTTLWEGLGEYYQFANSDLTGGARSSSRAGYAQLGRRFDALTPYLRYERASLAPGDLYFASQTMGRSYTRASLGARYDLGAKAALKAEFGATREAAVTLLDDSGAARFVSPASYRRLAFEYSIAF